MADDIVVRAKYAREWGDWGNLHEEPLAEVERLRGALDGLVRRWKFDASTDPMGITFDHIAAIESVLRGGQ